MNNVLSKYLFYYPVTMANGENVSRYLKSYRISQYWTREELAAYQEIEIKKILKISMKSKYYESRIDTTTLLNKSGAGFFDAFSREVPVLTKKELINYKSELRTNNGAKVSIKTTGGSTGEPVTVYKDSIGLAKERAATWRAYEWAGVTIGSKQARFWGVPHNNANKLKARLIDFVSNRKRFSAFDLDLVSLNKIAVEILQYKPDYLYGYVSAIRELAEFVIDNQKFSDTTWPFNCIITTSEVLTERDRSILERAFQCSVYNEYGCGEVGSIAHECKFGSMHVMSENVYLEQSDNGELIVTDLHNTAMPLIRYRIGDFAQSEQRTCQCGVELPVLTSIGGRAYDIIKTPEGRKIHPEAVIYIFEGLQQKNNYFNHFQVVQTSDVDLLINLVPTSTWTDSAIQEINNGVVESISSGMKVKINLVDTIPREASGKMRVVKYLGEHA